MRNGIYRKGGQTRMAELSSYGAIGLEGRTTLGPRGINALDRKHMTGTLSGLEAARTRARRKSVSRGRMHGFQEQQAQLIRQRMGMQGFQEQQAQLVRRRMGLSGLGEHIATIEGLGSDAAFARAYYHNMMQAGLGAAGGRSAHFARRPRGRQLTAIEVAPLGDQYVPTESNLYTQSYVSGMDGGFAEPVAAGGHGLMYDPTYGAVVSFSGLGDNYNATSAAQCGADEMFITDVGCVTRGAPAGSSGGGSSSSPYMTGSGGSSGGGTDWGAAVGGFLKSIFGGGSSGPSCPPGTYPSGPNQCAPLGQQSGIMATLKQVPTMVWVGGAVLAAALLLRKSG